MCVCMPVQYQGNHFTSEKWKLLVNCQLVFLLQLSLLFGEGRASNREAAVWEITQSTNDPQSVYTVVQVRVAV